MITKYHEDYYQLFGSIEAEVYTAHLNNYESKVCIQCLKDIKEWVDEALSKNMG